MRTSMLCAWSSACTPNTIKQLQLESDSLGIYLCAPKRLKASQFSAPRRAATQEISRNVQQASQGTMQVSSDIMGVQRSASETGSASSQVLSAAQSLSRDSKRLKLDVGKFLETVQAAQ